MALLKPASIVLIFLNILTPCIQGSPTVSNLPLHGRENSTFMKQIYNAEFGKKVPEYEIVQLRILSKRDADDQNVLRIHLSAFGKDIPLRLERNDDFNDRSKEVKFFKGSLTDTGVQLTEVILDDDDPGIPYIDVDQMAAVTIHYGPDGELQMDGMIGDDFLIKPAPNDDYSIDYITHDWGVSDDESNFYGYSTSAPIKDAHIVYRSPMKSKSSFEVTLDDVVKNIYSATNDTSNHKRPLHAFPEVLLMVDYDTYALHVSHGLNDAQMKRYYVSFFNGVDLRFKILSDPKISLILSRIVIFTNRDDTPFLKNNLHGNRSILNGNNALRDLARHMYSHREIYPEIDIAILLTKFDMCSYQFIFCSLETVGLAYLKGACNILRREKAWMGVAIVEDSGGFDGILTAAHEIGHLLGLEHDGVPLEDGHASNCSDEDGYIMTHKMTSNRIFQWSECSIKQFGRFLSSKKASCLFNKPSYHNKLEGSELPGAVLSLDEQCKRILGTRASAWDSRVCHSLHCHAPIQDVMSKKRMELPPAAEGSSCGEGLHCRHGKCVSKYLIYSQAWNMAPVHDSLEYIDSTTTEEPTMTTEKPSFTDLACKGDKDEFCDSYFPTIGRKEACQNSRIREECCYSYKIFCKVRRLKKTLL